MGSEPRRLHILSNLGEGTLGTTYSARLDGAALVAAKRLTRGAALPPVQKLARLGPSSAQALVSYREAFSEAGERWVLSDRAAGESLKTVLERGRLAPMCAVVVAMDVLEAVAALHQVDLWHGTLHAGNVHLGTDGSVRLGDYCLAAAEDQTPAKLRAADMQAVGVLLCAMLRLPLEGESGRKAARTSKLAESPLGQLARRMARGPRGKRLTASAAIDARLALWEAAGRLATRRMQAAARERLAGIVAAPVVSAPIAAPVKMPAPPRLQGVRPWARPAVAVLAACLVAGVISPVGLLRSAHGSRPLEGATSSEVAVLPAPVVGGKGRDEISGAVTPPPPSAPSLGPPAAGKVTAVRASWVDPGCTAGSTCMLHVEVWVQPSSQARLVAWTVKSVSPCQGAPVEVAQGAFTAKPGWTHVASENPVQVPARPSSALVVVATAPDVAASAPLPAGATQAAC